MAENSKFHQSAMQGRGGPPGMQGERAKLKNTKQTIMRILGYLSERKIAISFAIFFIVANSVLAICATYMVRPIINGLLESAGTTALVKNLTTMAVIYLFAFFANYMQSRLMIEIAQSSLERMREDLFVKLQKLPLKYFDSNNNGDLMSRFTNDVDAVSNMLSTTCVQLISGVITIITTTAIMFYTNWMLTLVMLIIIPFFSYVSKQVSKRSMKFYKGQQKAIGDLNGFIEERVSGQKVIKVFNHEDETVEEFENFNEDYTQKYFKAQALSGCMGPIMGGLAMLSYSITAVVGGLLCVFTGFDVGGYTIFVNYARSFSQPINAIFMQINTIFAALAGAERVFEVIDQNAEIEDVENAIIPEKIVGNVEFDNVDFGYREGKLVLKNISIKAKTSQKIAFVGSTGAGKTTITNLINRFYDINAGSIKIDGEDIKNYNRDFLRQNVAMVLQDTHLFTGTVRDNIRYGRLDATDEEVISAAKTANAHSFIIRLENGYDTILDGDGGNLSQGQRQLLNIARAAISKAPILVLDEATSSVDTRTERHIEQALDRLTSERTTFVIAHRLSTVRNSDEIIVLEQGEIIEQGSHEELLENKGKYYNLYTGLSILD
ncbi:MAG: ABC transporter ATP-binding protein [Bacillota bacterium]